ncbi:MAG: nucleotide exchange factor GrpE [Sphingomonadales bacterium]|nr:nucleotide exchange factor GrpE [Sphingomonadales bacterium]
MMNEETPQDDENVNPDDAEGVEEGVEETPQDDAVDEVVQLKDRLMRAMAESENVRRRAEKQVADASSYAVASFARDMLAVSDNLRRTLDALPDDLRENEALKVFLDGIEMTERELLNSFEKSGIRKIMPEEGEKFDHNMHQAMFEAEVPGAVPGTVIQVAQPGYVLKDRLLRPAMVGVAKAPAGGAPKVDETA